MVFTMVSTIGCIYSNCLLMMNSYSIRNMYRIDYWNKLRKKIASCWSLLRTYITIQGPQNVKFHLSVVSTLLIGKKKKNIILDLTKLFLRKCSLNCFQNSFARTASIWRAQTESLPCGKCNNATLQSWPQLQLCCSFQKTFCVAQA